MWCSGGRLPRGLPRRPLRLHLAAATGSGPQPPPPADDGSGGDSGSVRYPDVYQGRSYADPVDGTAGDTGSVSSADAGVQESGTEAGVRPESDVFAETYQGVEPPGFSPQRYFAENRWARGAAFGTGAFFVITLAIALFRVAVRHNSPTAKRRRTVEQNKAVVEALDEYLPSRRDQLSPGILHGLRSRSGFTAVEVFRKYLWYLLRERKFDEDAVQDLAALKAALGMSDSEVATALRDRAQRIYEKYGNVMLDVAGMTKAGIERKATCRALFSKLLYLAESERLLPQDGEARSLSIPEIFGATSEDADQLRIVSLYEVDLDNLENQFLPDFGGDLARDLPPPPAV
ncbi:hypothetical protein WJX81_003170 [Elliptochloris bilobata]|uniref:Armadillo-like repeats domain-containing protein n=1 Tax=Elliptochloris bilobata TaxID=381761 RepID=A0AAW1S6H2_9CHLO